jgi:DNA replication protein DnaC
MLSPSFDKGWYHGDESMKAVAAMKKRCSKKAKKMEEEIVANGKDYTQLVSGKNAELNKDEGYKEDISRIKADYDEVLHSKVLKLRQKGVLLSVLRSIEDVVKVSYEKLAPSEARTCRLLLQGPAGTGKTFVLLKAVEYCVKYLTKYCVRVFAPTACAANAYSKYNAQTFHRLFRKAVRDNENGNENAKLNNAEKVKFTMEMKNVRALICDEISMLSPADIYLMNSRLQESFGNNNVCKIL